MTESLMIDPLRRVIGPGDFAGPLVVAFSGGLDSTVLLDVVARLVPPRSLLCCHVHHGLQPQADAWAEHCLSSSAGYGIRCEVRRLEPPSRFADGVEAWAGAARRGALLDIARAHGASAVLLAHHADDQVETLLLNLGRGAGLAGIAGMTPVMVQRGMRWLRPWLDVRRTVLHDYATRRSLTWVEDPSNDDLRLRRNAVRHQVLPLLEQTFPGFADNALRAGEVAAQTGEALALLLDKATGGRALGRSALREQAGPVRAVWLRSALAAVGLRPPTQRRLQDMLRQLVDSDGPYAQIRHDGSWVRRYRDRILIEPAHGLGPAAVPVVDSVLAWQGEPAIELPEWRGALYFAPAMGDEPGIARERLLGLRLELGPMAMSAPLRLRSGAGSRPVRKHCQAVGLPAWERRRQPMLRAQGRVLYVGGLGMDADWFAPIDAGSARIVISFEPCDGDAGPPAG